MVVYLQPWARAKAKVATHGGSTSNPKMVEAGRFGSVGATN